MREGMPWADLPIQGQMRTELREVLKFTRWRLDGSADGRVIIESPDDADERTLQLPGLLDNRLLW